MMQNKKYRWLRHRLNDPFIWILIFPVVLLDIFTEIYHQIGFRLCDIPLVKRSEYIKIDRHKLGHLPFDHKIGCMYCGYVNGFLHYAKEIAGRTENYWCSIKHEEDENFKEPQHHKDFMARDDKDGYKKKYQS